MMIPVVIAISLLLSLGVSGVEDGKNVRFMDVLAPDMAANVKKEWSQNIQIHDSFGDLEKQDIVAEKKVRTNKNLAAMMFLDTKKASKIDGKKRYSSENLDLFQKKRSKGDNWGEIEDDVDKYLATVEHKDVPQSQDAFLSSSGEAKNSRFRNDEVSNTKNQPNEVISVKLNSQLQESLLQKAVKTAPNVENMVAKQRMEDVYIHDGFKSREVEDKRAEAKVRSNPNLRA